jgi:hypothetical protein
MCGRLYKCVELASENSALLYLQARGSMLNFVSAFLTFMAIGGFPSFVEDMKVYSISSSIIH